VSGANRKTLARKSTIIACLLGALEIRGAAFECYADSFREPL